MGRSKRVDPVLPLRMSMKTIISVPPEKILTLDFQFVSYLSEVLLRARENFEVFASSLCLVYEVTP